MSHDCDSALHNWGSPYRAILMPSPVPVLCTPHRSGPGLQVSCQWHTRGFGISEGDGTCVFSARKVQGLVLAMSSASTAPLSFQAV